MASTPKPVKLAELLQKQQEPFVLEVYLSERGYLRKSSSTNSNSSKKLTRSSSWGNLSCPKILRYVYKKLVSRHSETTSIKGCEKREEESNAGTDKQRSSRENGESDRFSSASGRTQYDLCTRAEKNQQMKPLFRCEMIMIPQLQQTLLNSQVLESCNMKERETNFRSLQKCSFDLLANKANRLLQSQIERLNGQSSEIHCKQQNPVSVPEDKPPHANASLPLHNKRFYKFLNP